MKQQEMKNIIDKYIRAYNSFDIEGMLTVMHRDVTFQNVSNDIVNMTANGADELREAAEKAKNLFKSRAQKVRKYDYKNDTATIEIDFAGVLSADMLDGPKAGETLRLKGRSVFKFKDGLIISLTDYS